MLSLVRASLLGAGEVLAVETNSNFKCCNFYWYFNLCIVQQYTMQTIIVKVYSSVPNISIGLNKRIGG